MFKLNEQNNTLKKENMEKAIACLVDKSIRLKRQRELTEAEEENISKMYP